MSDKLEIRRQENPFEAGKVLIAEAVIEPGKSLAAYVAPFETQGPITVIYNGQQIDPVLRNQIVPRVGDQIILKPKIQDSGILRMFAMISLLIISIAAPYLSPSLAAFQAVHPVLFAAAQGAFMMAGATLVNVLLPMPKAPEYQQSPSYAWDGPTMTSRQGIPIPRGYGVFRCG